MCNLSSNGAGVGRLYPNAEWGVCVVVDTPLFNDNLYLSEVRFSIGFSDACMTNPSTCSGGRRPRSAKV